MGLGERLADGSLNFEEDFHYDRQLVEFLDYYSHHDYATAEVELVVNGDFFNMLALDKNDPAPQLMTEEKSVRKIAAILRGHRSVWEALSRFSSAYRHRIVFVVGNHEPGLLFPAAKDCLKMLLAGNVELVDDLYEVDRIHIEHGNQYFPDNRYNPRRYFLSDGLEEKIINLPWGSHFLLHFLYPIKRERWYIDKVYPFKLYLRWALANDSWFAFKVIFRLLKFFFTYRFWHHPHRPAPFGSTLEILRQITLSPRLHREAKRILLSDKDCRAVIFGHTHIAEHLQIAPNKEYLNTGTWSDGISLDVGSIGRRTRLTFVLIDYPNEDDRPLLSLKQWKGTYHLIEETY